MIKSFKSAGTIREKISTKTMRLIEAGVEIQNFLTSFRQCPKPDTMTCFPAPPLSIRRKDGLLSVSTDSVSDLVGTVF